MHIAICDDNVADRKQLERMLKKTSEIFTDKTEGFYVDSYGNCSALFRSPMLYDVFFLDLTEGEVNGMDVCQKLLQAGVHATIILCSSTICYPKIVTEHSLPDNVLFLDKPLKKTDLTEMLHIAHSARQTAIPHIELREESGEYYYVTEPDILYAVSAGKYLQVTLRSKKVLSILSTLDNLYSQLEKYPSFFLLNRKVLINGRHLAKVHLFTATMTDGSTFPIHPQSLAYAKYALEEFR